MSHASHKVTWCLHKAERELKECEEQGKDPVHRGLREVDPDQQLADAHLIKARHNLQAMQKFNDDGYSDWSASAAFYASYHCFLSLCAKHGYESRNQICTIAVIDALIEDGTIALDKKFISFLTHQEKQQEKKETAIDIREQMAYGVEVSLDQEDFDKLLSMCKELVDATSELIEQ